jgi:putative drug exporter of the RND superfamily
LEDSLLHSHSLIVSRFRWPIVLIWLRLALSLFLFLPPMSNVAQFDQAAFLPPSTGTIREAKLAQSLFPEKGKGSSVTIVATRDGGIAKDDEAWLALLAQAPLKDPAYHATSVLSPYAEPDLREMMVSKDGKSAITNVSLDVPAYLESTGLAVHEYEALVRGQKGLSAAPEGLRVYVTGEAPIGEEVMMNVHRSMDITIKVTVFLVFLVLALIYRSPIAPLVPLATIGLSFLITRGCIVLLTYLGLKVSSLTETFLVAVLFGAGTDYCLLLISRYREQVAKGLDYKEALEEALPRSRIAILSSGGTVIIGFLGMVIAQFGLYNTTGPSVAIGIAITLFALLSLAPAILSILGKWVFWPLHPEKAKKSGKDEFKRWKKLADLVVSKPGRLAAGILVVFVPLFVVGMTQRLDYDAMSDLPPSSDVRLGFESMSSHFGQGELLPVRVALRTKADLYDSASLLAVDQLAASLCKVEGVAKVRTATRPLGEPIDATRLGSQVKQISEGLVQVGDATASLAGGLERIQSGLGELAKGLDSGARDMGKLVEGGSEAADGVGSLRLAFKVAQNKAKRSPGKEALQGQADAIGGEAGKALAALDSIIGGLAKDDPQRQTLLKARETLAAVADGADRLSSDLGKAQLASPEDYQMLETQVGKLQDGLLAINDGQAAAQAGMAKAAKGAQALQSGLGQASGGALQLSKGLVQAKDATSGYAKESGLFQGIFYLPPGTLEAHPELKKAMDAYVAKDAHGLSLEVVLSVPPYSPEALDASDAITEAVGFAIRGTALEGAEYAVGGPTSTFADLRRITTHDLNLVIVVVLIGIFVVLVILLKSVVAPIYLMLTTIVSYGATLGLCSLVFKGILGFPGLTWSVPFFSFCILVALGVDYNIFLMSRVREEYRPGDNKGAIWRALSSTGKIITSCGVIMAGTFGALIGSPMNQVMEIGFCTVVGLLVDTVIIRCILVPSLAVKVGELNWWPGRKIKVSSAEAIEGDATGEVDAKVEPDSK